MKKITKTVALILTAMIARSVSALSITASAISSDIEETENGNVPVTYIPGSEITFDADGSFEITHMVDPAPRSLIHFLTTHSTRGATMSPLFLGEHV